MSPVAGVPTGVDEPLAGLGDRQALIHAIETNQLGVMASIGDLPGAEVEDGPDMLRITTGVPVAFLNVVGRTRLADGKADRAIERTLQHYRSRNVPAMWSVEPSSRPRDLRHRLESHGLLWAETIPCMARDLSGLLEVSGPDGLQIDAVETDEAYERMVRTAAASFAAPEFVARALIDAYRAAAPGLGDRQRLFIGSLDGRDVAVTVLRAGGGVAGVYAVGTVPEARRRGIGSSMTMAALRWGRSLGYRVGVLGATAMGFGVYRKLGFQEICRTESYVTPYQPAADPVASRNEG